MKLNKSIAGLEVPEASSIGALGDVGANVNSVIIIGFADVEVYGKTNGAWELVDVLIEPAISPMPPDTSGAISPMPPDTSGIRTNPDRTIISLENYEDVFFVSKSGKEEYMRFFFMEDSIVSSAGESKINSVTEVSDMPVFSASDAGKILSVNSEGNLAWTAR